MILPSIHWTIALGALLSWRSSRAPQPTRADSHWADGLQAWQTSPFEGDYSDPPSLAANAMGNLNAGRASMPIRLV